MRTIIVCMAMLTASAAGAQKLKKTEVPQAVLTAFAEHFKAVKAESWEKENGNYEAEFDLDKKETSATFAPDGKLLETETEIKTSALPKPVTDYIARNYAAYKLTEAAKIVDHTGAVKYEAEVEKDKKKSDLIFDANGNFEKKKD